MTADKLVSGQLTDQQRAEVMTKLAEIQKTLGFLVTMTMQERARIAKPGSDALAAAESVVVMLESHSQYFSTQVVDPKEIRKDLALIKALTPMLDVVQGLADAISDTLLAAKSDTFRAVLKSYTLAQVIAQQVPGMSASLQPLKEVFERPARKRRERASLSAKSDAAHRKA